VHPTGQSSNLTPAAKSLLRRYKKGTLRWRKEGSGRRITDLRGRNVGALEKPQTSITPAMRAELLARYEAGATILALAAWSGAHRETVMRHLVHAGFEPRQRGLTAEQVQTARELYVEGFTLAEIAGRFGVGATTVRRSLLRLGISLRPTGRRAQRSA
jgi:DNA-directed RNA polymerase specialized sigma24 family protein